MLTAKDVEVARELVKHLELPEEFGGSEDMDTSDWEYKFQDFIEGNFYISCGVSKMVIIVDNLPFVIKIPFNGRWEMDWDNDDELYFCQFDNACDRDATDYCLDELEKTISIQEEGYGCFIPDMIGIGNVSGREIYIQEKVKPLYECKKLVVSEASLNTAKKSHHVFRDDWIARVFDVYGEDTWNGFINFLKNWEPEVLSDMHSGNYGITFDGSPVLFDLSGFRD